MGPKGRARAVRFAKRILSREELERYKKIKIKDTGHGYDVFGWEWETGVAAFALGKLFHKHYFRVESHGHENVPKEGGAILAANHSGVLPTDATMVVVDLILKGDPPRVTRGVVDRGMISLPFFNTFAHRIGMITGNKRDFEVLLEQEDLVIVFPEGVKGIGKTYDRKYKLVRFNVGFLEIALNYKVPIIPTAIIGAEEQQPMLYNLKGLAKTLGLPYLPITPTFPLLGPLGILPLPTKYHIYYGEPMNLHEEFPPEATNDPDLIRDLADRVQDKVQEMINEGLEKRQGIFV